MLKCVFFFAQRKLQWRRVCYWTPSEGWSSTVSVWFRGKWLWMPCLTRWRLVSRLLDYHHLLCWLLIGFTCALVILLVSVPCSVLRSVILSLRKKNVNALLQLIRCVSLWSVFVCITLPAYRWLCLIGLVKVCYWQIIHVEQEHLWFLFSRP